MRELFTAVGHEAVRAPLLQHLGADALIGLPKLPPGRQPDDVG
ncbi:hypothetical protein [Kitasatospora phosalacinea]|uniref:Uncharacterized protein n=1 Tax=Kitasatospora phosalacinea TaxID=2065 RepID=A0A9W6PHR8_9ACTN|nr:hypothetical protein [Kitasatospora phosalacinea]GLW55081.1 hypothetical protein Kpho01_30920 [Kitasatospora phosalacinea]